MERSILTEQEATEAAEVIDRLRRSLNSVLFGQEDLIDKVIVAVIARGHLLLEGLPGLGKTELVKGLARSIELHAKRIQFTPDLLPGDITGSPILNSSAGGASFVFQRGPIFANIVLADETNRASPKTQSALLEAMQERRVTVMSETHELPSPFFVLATQNPIELEGTYPLPEAQLDRFLFKLDVIHADASVLERIVLEREMGVECDVKACLSAEQLRDLTTTARRVFLPDVAASYISRLVDGTHPGRSKSSQGIKFGASPRAALGLAAAARAGALARGRINASFDDVASVAHAVLGHRIVLDYTARIEGKTQRTIIDSLLAETPRQRFQTPPTLTTEETRQ